VAVPSVRLYYTQADGRVVEVEQRPDEDYTDDNLTRGDMAGLKVKVVDVEQVAEIPVEELQVRRGKLRRAGKRDEPPPADRIAEIRAMDRSELSDTEWLAVFREYAEATGLMDGRTS
jgi:hypothetical protein